MLPLSRRFAQALKLVKQQRARNMSEPETKSQTGSTEKGPLSSVSDVPKESHSEIDLLAYHEHNAGRLVVDPEYAS